MKVQKKVSFFRLSLNIGESCEVKNAEVEKRFASIYKNKMNMLSDDRKAIKINEKYVVEVLKYVNHMAFLIIGVENSSNVVSLRNSESLESEQIPMKDGQMLEVFTYCLFDFETCIITYICLNGMTSLSALRDLFSDIDATIVANLVPIVTKDVLKKIVSKKDIVSKFTVKLAIPCDKMLSSELGLPMDKFDNLQNIKSQTVTLQISAKRNTSLFSTGNRCVDFFNNLISKMKNCDLRKLSVTAKNTDESTHDYDVFLEKFSKTLILEKEDLDTYQSEDFFEQLNKVYSETKNDLLAYIR